MDVTPQLPESAPLIQRYGTSGFTIGGIDHAGSVLIGPHATQSWSAQAAGDIDMVSLSPLFGQRSEIEMLILGSGQKQIFLPPTLREALRREGMIVDVMDTGAACRTFNILLSEGRRVAAALLPPDR